MQRSDGSQQQEAGGSNSGHPSTAATTTMQSPMAQMRVASRPAVIAAPSQGQAAIGVIPVGQQNITSTATSFALAPQPAIIATSVRPAVAAVAAPQAMVVSSQTVSRLLSPPSTLQSNTVQLPATLNVLQRQLSAPGVVGLSAVSAQDLQQVLQQVSSQQSITLLTADPPATVAGNQPRPRLARPLSFPQSAASPSPALQSPPTSSVSATGGTIHHHGQSPVRGGSSPLVAATLSHSNLHQSILSMNLNQQQLAAAQRRVVTTATTTTTTASPATAVVTSQTPRTSEPKAGTSSGLSYRTATGQPPRKKIKVEEKPAATTEITNYRRMIIDVKHKEMLEIKANYFENLTEMFFLQNGNNLMDYHSWKKRPTPQLVNFLKSGNLDSDDEEDILQVKEINAEVKVLTNPGSNVPLATPVAISTTLPPMVSALSQQGSEHRSTNRPVCLPGFSHSLSAAFSVVAPSGQTVSAGAAGGTSTSSLSQSGLPSSSTAASATSQLQIQLSRSHESKSAGLKGQVSPSKLHKSPPVSPSPRLNTRQQSISAVYDNLSGGSQEVIVERAKQEAQVMQRVAELRKEGLWSSRRLPRVQEPPRQKAHWDYLLEEMTWLAADFVQERKWKKAAARKLARMVSNYFKEQEQKELRAEKEEAIKLKKIASHMAKMVKEFWTNIEKVVQYKQQTRLEEKKKKALDLHLNFIVDQTEKYSTWLTEGLKGGSVSGSLSTSPAHSSDGGDFEPSDNTTDDEETIEKEEKEAALDEVETKKELEDLEKEGELPLEELLKTLPEEVLAAPAPLPPTDAEDTSGEEEEETKEDEEKEPKEEKKEGEEEGSDKEFAGTEEEAVDEEDTIAEQEKHEKRDYKDELKDLQEEGEMSIEELAAKYAGAYDSDFEMPQESSCEEEEESESDSDDFEIETEESSEEEEEEEEKDEEDKEDSSQAEDEPGLEALVKPSGDVSSVSKPQKQSGEGKEKKEQDPTREDLADIAEQAQSLQPKGYTLETTEVKTKVPFLLKHTLREYQHVGLDWLATMHEKRLNGILADEMGLGKTIQTIALLAHLACEKGVWGPHLIVVPTSVMLNWEMELKKWCPAFKILTYYGNQKERKLKRQGWTKTNAFHVCITSYKLVVQDHQAFRRKRWKYLILDEAQNIKNFKSQRWQMLLNFTSQRRLLLTGTPLQNSLMELWSLMHFLMPNVFQSHRDFKEWFSNPLTGMIEGSQEYNESLIKRLHKVLRPFLLRRLKNEVEKQMPKKFEHVVMCRLSKRQRFLYDDFMAQAKTKETLATGHYMSVINILMQLRKVCNHPNLFDPRPIVSPFRMEGLVYSTASLVTRALEQDPFENVDIRTLFPNLVEMERDLPAFVSHRVKQLKTQNNLIEEIDSQPDPPPRPPPGQLKSVAFRSVSPAVAQSSGRASPVSLLPQARSGSPVDAAKAAQLRAATPPAAKSAIILPTVPSSTATLASSTAAAVVASASATLSQVRTTGGQTLLLTSQARTGSTLILSTVGQTVPTLTVVTATSTPSSAAAPAATLQAKVVPQQLQGTSASASVLTTQPITVQIQQTEQGTRLMIPTGQLSSLPASLFQIVQTPSGQQLIATSSATQVSSVVPLQTAVTTTASSTVNGPSPSTTVAATSSSALVTTAVSHVKTVPALTTAATTSPSASVGTATTAGLVSTKPVMRVSPMVAASTGAVTTTSTSLTGSIVSTSASLLGVKPVEAKKSVLPVKRSEMYLECLHERREKRRKEKLRRLARINSAHCSQTPVYGPDVHQALSFVGDVGRPSTKGDHWLSQGYANCLCAHTDHNFNHPHYYWHETTHLAKLIHTPDQYLDELKDILDRFVFATPSVISPGIRLRVAHPDPSQVVRELQLEHSVRDHLRPLSSRLNAVQTKATIQFPELRLIQYDCGKLQTLDVLLRRLKSEHHRVLIFTQMTKMLDVLEAFLNYHGHRYLRLDGTTKVEQRQALMDRFNADRRIFCFILSTRSGGIGVNLTGADTVIFYDSDWNPTMDAQAQDRCHRIGQTRDVHIYRLISEMTVEENILKKANQKRLLGDLAIEGGNFTTAFFKEQTIKDLFAQPSGLKSLADQQQQREQEKMEVVEQKEVQEEKAEEGEGEEAEKTAGNGKKDANLLAAFEQALCKAEDETDAIAATLVKAEQKAELAEFDETIPWDEREAEAKKEEEEMSRAEMELAMLDKELTPIERYAVTLVESQMEDEVMEELKMAEEDIENSKKDWELARLKALKEEEERRAELEDDEMLYTYLRDDAQVKRRTLKPSKPKKAPGRPAARSPRSPSISGSDTGSVDSRPARISSRVALRKQLVSIGRRGRGRGKAVEESPSQGESDSSVGVAARRGGRVAGRGRGAKVKIKIEQVGTGDNDEKVLKTTKPPVVKVGRRTPTAVRIKKNNIAAKQAIDLNGSATPEEVKAATKVVRRVVDREPILLKLNAEAANGEDISLPKPPTKVVRKPRQAGGKQLPGVKQKTGGETLIAQASPVRAILKVPTMTSPSPAGAGKGDVILGTLSSPPRNKSPVAVTTTVTSPSANVPPPWSNPNLVIRTRRASMHSPVAVSGAQVVQGVQQSPSVVQGSIGLVQQTSPSVVQPSVGIVQQSGGVVRLISPSGPLMALAASQPGTRTVQMVSAASVRPGATGTLTGTSLSLAGARVVASPQQVVSAAGLAGSLVRLPDGSTAVLGQISGGNIISGQQTGSPTIIVSAAGQVPLGARAVLATTLNAARARAVTPRAAVTQPQIVSASGIRTLQLGTGITTPLTLRGVGGMPVGVNLLKAGSSIPIVGGQGLALRGGQLIQTSLGQAGAPQSFVLITPRVRAPAPTQTPAATAAAPATPTPAPAPAPAPQNVFISSLDGSEMPIWAPPTPPQDDNDVYLDQTMLFLHEPSVMAESQLPPVYVRKEHKKPRVETITTRKQKQRKEEAPRVPRSLFDRPTAVLLKMRREIKMKNLKAGLINKPPYRPTPPLPPGKPVMEQSEGHPEWLIHEDWALLQAVQTLQNLPLNLTVVSPAHIPNWDLVAEVVNSCSRVYRSVKQCKARYENVIIPREEGRILYDVSPRKQKKTKGIYKTKNNRPMKTSQLYTQDGNSSISLLYSLRFDSVKSLASKRPATMRQTLNNPTLKNPKHAAVLQENGINYDQPLNPMQVAAIRAERIAREKKQNQAAAQAAAEQMAAQRNQQQQQQQQQQQGAVQAVTGVAASAPAVAQAVTGQQLHSLVSVTTPTTIIQTGPAPKVAVGQGMTAVSIARTLPATGSIVAVTGSLAGVRGQRAVVHEITTVASNVTAAQVAAQAQARASLPSTQQTASANLTAQLANTQKIAAMAGTSAITGVQQLAAAKGLTQQINLLRPIPVRSQTPQSAAQPQQIRAQKLSFATQKQAGLLRTMTSEQIQALKQRQLQQKHAQSGQQLPTQILQQQVGQSGTSAAAPVTLVKSVAAPVSINVTMGQGQQKQGITASRNATVSQLQQQRMQVLHQQQRKGVPIQQPQKVTALTGQARAGQIPLIIPPQGKITGHLLHQIVKNQQIIHTSQPAIITAVTQGQTLQPMKVSLTTVPHTAPIQTLSAAAGSPITVTQVAAPATPSGSSTGQTHSVATISMPMSQTVVKTATLTMDPSQQQQGSMAPKVATISQSLVAQPLQLASSPISQQQTQQAQSIVAAGTQHRVLTASSATINPTPTAVVVSATSIPQTPQPGATTVVQQATPQPQQQQQQQPQSVVSAQLVASSIASSQAVPSPGAVATVVTQTQQAQAQQQSAQQQPLTPQQQLQKASPYTMRTRNPPKH